jgi:hypothetical protein
MHWVAAFWPCSSCEQLVVLQKASKILLTIHNFYAKKSTMLMLFGKKARWQIFDDVLMH